MYLSCYRYRFIRNAYTFIAVVIVIIMIVVVIIITVNVVVVVVVVVIVVVTVFICLLYCLQCEEICRQLAGLVSEESRQDRETGMIPAHVFETILPM